MIEGVRTIGKAALQKQPFVDALVEDCKKELQQGQKLKATIC